ncbi:MAG: hypothetical protein ABSC32_06605 [Steroidobacteraceae bacterium]|jgi:hypothetical protein
MSSRLYFLLSQSLPLAAAGMGYFVPKLDIFIFFMKLAFVPYIVTVVVTSILIYRASSMRALAKLSIATPAAFAIALGGFVLIVGRVPDIHRTFSNVISSFFAVAGFGGLFAYAYVMAAWGLWALAVRYKLVKNEFAV